MTIKDILTSAVGREVIHTELECKVPEGICLDGAIEETIALGGNCTLVLVKDNAGNSYEFECTILQDKVASKYLLETKLFNKSVGQMVNTHIQLLDGSLNKDNTEHADIYCAFNWELV